MTSDPSPAQQPSQQCWAAEPATAAMTYTASTLHILPPVYLPDLRLQPLSVIVGVRDDGTVPSTIIPPVVETLNASQYAR
jgi:hypothetical protein